MSRRELLDSWKDIAAYLRRDVRTCQTWEKELGLPVHRLQDSPKARVFAYQDEIDRWVGDKLREREAGDARAKAGRAKRARAAAAVILVMAGGTFLFWRLPSRPSRSAAASGRPAIAVLDFENLSRDPALDSWKDGLPELLITGLSQSHFVNVLTRDQSDSIVKRLKLIDKKELAPEDLSRIAAAGGLTRLITGSFLKAGDGVVVTLTLFDPRSGTVIDRAKAECRNPAEIPSRTDELTLRVRQYLNLSGAQLDADAQIYKKVEVATTASPEALVYYLEGRRLQHRMEYPASIAYMEKAVALDPEFAMAYRSMASAYRNLGHMGQALEYARKSIALSARLPELERMSIEGFYTFWSGDTAGSAAIWERILKLYPESWGAHTALSIIIPDPDRVIALREYAYRLLPTALTAYNLAHGYLLKGLPQEAENVCRVYLEEVEDSPGVRDGLLQSYLVRRRFDLALAEAERISLPRPENDFYRTAVGDVRLLMGDDEGAEAVYRRVPLLKAYINRSNIMILALARGQFTAAVAEARRNLEAAGDDKRLKTGAYEDLAVALEKAARLDEAGRVWADYLDVSAAWRRSGNDDTKYDVPGLERAVLFIQGRLLAERGAFDEARKRAAELKELCEKTGNPRELRYPEFILGLIDLGQKRARDAVALLSAARGRLFQETRWEDAREFALFYDALASAVYASGDLKRARREYEALTRLTVGRLSHGDLYARAFYSLGRIAERQGDKARARENYGKFLELWKDSDPGLAEVEDARSRLAALGR